MARLIRIGVVLLIILILGFAGWRYAQDYIRDHPQDVPWTRLSLSDPIGRFTLSKLTALADDPALCRALLDEAGADDTPAPARTEGPDCGYETAVLLQPAPGDAAMTPPGVIVQCPLAAALVVWERQVLQPAAQRHFGSRVEAIDHAGSYSCRRLYGRPDGAFSEHATANAFDITGVRPADRTRVSILRDWAGATPKSAFLKDIRDGACDLFATALSPDYNAAHADHLHFDMAARGRSNMSVCR